MLTRQPSAKAWELVRRQHGVVAHRQLVDLGFNSKSIDYRIAAGKLHPVYRGVYAVGRPELEALGKLMAAVLACGPSAAVCHLSAAALTKIVATAPREIHVSIEGTWLSQHRGIVVHRRRRRADREITLHRSVPITSPIWTLIDIATDLDTGELERAINEADKRGLIRVAALRRGLEEHRGRAGVGRLVRILDARSFVLTDSELERRFSLIARRAGLPLPTTRIRLDGYRVDFYWAELDLVIETDGFGFHRTPSQMTRDAERMQAHVTAGRTALRFSHGQIRYDPAHVATTLRKVEGQIQSRH